MVLEIPHVDEKRLALPALRSELYLDGDFVQGRGEQIVVSDPSTEQELARFAGANEDQVSTAVQAARNAFEEGVWRDLNGRERGRLIERLADAYERRFDDLLVTIVHEAGTPISTARGLQVAAPLAYLRWFAEQAAVDRTVHLPTQYGEMGHVSYVANRPVGVVAALAAYNYPLVTAFTKVAAALAAGCTVVVMPSPATPLTTLMLGEILQDADLPPGVVNILAGRRTSPARSPYAAESTRSRSQDPSL